MKSLTVLASLLLGVIQGHAEYLIVVSKATQSKPEWQKVVKALQDKHSAKTIVFDKNPSEILPTLQKAFPRHTCFVCQPDEVNKAFVREVHQLTRGLDEDPYSDTQWGILTGHDADNALTIAKTKKPLVIERVSSGTEVELERCREGVWYCELKKNHAVRKKEGEEPRPFRTPTDTTKLLVDSLNQYKAQLFVTSGHATERDWQIGYRYRNGSFRSGKGQLYGLDLAGQRHLVNSPNPKVYMPIGNCLMGHINGQDAMALAFLKNAGVHQMLGYIVPTWYGYAGWGVLDYFVEQPGRHSFTEAFFANQHALIHRLKDNFPDLLHQNPTKRLSREACAPGPRGRSAGLGPVDGKGLLFDRDVVTFYGDPAWEARMANGRLNWNQGLVEGKPGHFTFTVEPLSGPDTFKPVNINGAQRGGRPIVHHFPERLGDIKILKGKKWNPVITDDFLLLPLPGKDWKPGQKLVVEFQASRT